MAFHSVGRLLFHTWIPPGEDEDEGIWTDDDELNISPHELPSRSAAAIDSSGRGTTAVDRDSGVVGTAPRFAGGCSTPRNGVAIPACAEQAVLRLSLIIHEAGRRFDARVRTAFRSLAKHLHSRKKSARHLIARSALLVVDHGLANGSLDTLRRRFPPPSADSCTARQRQRQRRVRHEERSDDGAGDVDEREDTTATPGGSQHFRNESVYSSESDDDCLPSDDDCMTSDDDRVGKGDGIRRQNVDIDDRANRNDGGGRGVYGGSGGPKDYAGTKPTATAGDKTTTAPVDLGKDAMQYAAAIRFLVQVRHDAGIPLLGSARSGSS